MLPNEIQPFADQHINELRQVLNLLRDLRDPNSVIVPVTSADLSDAIERVSNAQNAFVRFRVCMLDEVKQKQKYREYWMEHNWKKPE